jgi:hypothetical protein
MTPIIVAIVSELLKRPTEKVTAVTVRRTKGGAVILEPPPQRQDEPFDPLAPAPTEELEALPQTTAPRSVHRRPLTGRQWKLALATGLIAFAGAATVVTASELLAGDPVSSDRGRTTLFGGAKKQKDDPKPGKDASPTPTPTPTPTGTPTPTPTPTPTATPTPEVTPIATPEPETTPTVSAPDPRPVDDPSQIEESRGEVLAASDSQVKPTARLTGLAGCVKTTRTVKVTGTRIRSVVFSLDAKTLRTVKAANRRVATTRVTVGHLKAGTHTLTAKVTFAGGTETKTLSLRFSRCTTPG